MKIDNVKRVIAALRSGQYVQGKHTMCTVDGAMCCLGVAYDQLVKPIERTGAFAKRTEDVNANEYHDVSEKLGLNWDISHKLSRLNDSDARSFKEIAAFLEGLVYAETNQWQYNAD